MLEIGNWGEVMHIGGHGFHWVDEAALAIHADVDLHPVCEAFRQRSYHCFPILLGCISGSRSYFSFCRLGHTRASPS